MQKLLTAILVLLVVQCFGQDESLYSFTLKDIDGKTVDMGQYEGKKVLIVIIPLNENGSSVIDQLAQFKAKYGTKVEVIGIPAIEYGFRKGDEVAVKKLYKTDRNLDITITEGINVKRGSGSSQSKLFQWLTDHQKNGHFSQEVIGIGHKFFVNGKGKLYSVLTGQTSISGQIMDRIINQPDRE